MRINGHSHILPKPNEIPQFMKDRQLFWIDNDRKFMRQDDWKRPITDEAFFLEGKLDWMSRHNIDHEVILTLSQLYANGKSRQDTDSIIRFQNDYHAALQADYPEKFTTGFVVQPLHLEDALIEIRRCVEDLNLSVLCLPTHFIANDGKWKSTSCEEAFPIFELADYYKLAVEIHPYDAPKFINLPNDYWRFHLVWMCAQTADFYHFYTLMKMQERFSDIRVCLAHGNQFGQVNTGRRKRGFKGRPDLFSGTSDPDEALGNHNIFVDSIVHDVLSFEIIARRSGISQIIAGLDNPYPLGEIDMDDSYPGKVIDEAVDAGVISAADRDDIWYKNVLRWLGKDKI